MVPNELGRTVVIPVRMNNGTLTCLYDVALPALEDGAVGDLVVPEILLESQSVAAWLQREYTVTILPKRQQVWLGVSMKQVDGNSWRFLTERPWGEQNFEGHQYLDPELTFIAVDILEPLRLFLRGTKSAQLRSCKCQVPALGIEAGSLNMAYSAISRRVEVGRRSHTANVFQRACFENESGKWETLEDSRQMFKARLESVIRFGLRMQRLKERMHQIDAPSIANSRSVASALSCMISDRIRPPSTKICRRVCELCKSLAEKHSGHSPDRTAAANLAASAAKSILVLEQSIDEPDFLEHDDAVKALDQASALMEVLLNA